MIPLIFILVSLLIVGLFIRYIGTQFGEQQLLQFLIVFLSVYIVYLCLLYQYSSSILVVKSVQAIKELAIGLFLASFILTHRDIAGLKFRLTHTDILFLLFLGIAFIYTVLPIGEAEFTTKASYFKSILLMGAMYAIGRNSSLSTNQTHAILITILWLTVVAGAVSFYEWISYQHVHSMIGFAKFNFDLYEIEPAGNYGLTWTFEAEYGKKRFGSIFANPLEMAANMLLASATALILLLKTPHRTNRILYIVVFLIAVFCIFAAYSRASFVAFFLMLFFIAFMFRSFKLIGFGLSFIVLLVLGYYFYLDEETQYYILDTISFQTSSSIGHVVEWAQGIESILENPMGIGLATSGNLAGVTEDLKVGGENQFIIYGVQLGVIGLFVYVLLLVSAIRRSVRVFRRSTNENDKLIPFVAGATKFGLLLPLFTSNTDGYAFITLITWWMVGYAIHLESKGIITHAKQEPDPR